MAGTADDKRITEYFTLNTADNICNAFQNATEKKEKMGEEVVMISCKQIVMNNYQCHIKNKAMNACLKEYSKFYTHIAGGNKSITIKMNDNMMIMAHQAKQYEKYKSCDDDNEWKQRILAYLEDTDYKNNFEDLFDGICLANLSCICLLHIFYVDYHVC